jgi:type IV pilus assembly protein PilM
LRFIRSKPQSVVGLEIKTHEVRLILLRQTKKMRVIEQMEVVDLPPGAIREGRIQMLDQVTERIRLIVQRLKIGNMPTVIALPIQSVMSKRIQFKKKLSHEKRKEWIEDNLLRYFPSVTEDLCYDYVILSTADALHETVLLIAARHDQLDDYVNMIERAGLCIKIIDVDLYALVRALKMTMTKDIPSTFSALLDINPDITQFILFNRNEIIFHQQLDYLDTQELASQLRSTIHLVSSTHADRQLDKLYFIDKTENDYNVIDRLQVQLGISFQCVNLLPFVNFSPSITIEQREFFSSKMMVSFGLALRRIPRW